MLRTHRKNTLSRQDPALSTAAPALRQAKYRPLLLTISTQTLAQWF